MAGEEREGEKRHHSQYTAIRVTGPVILLRFLRWACEGWEGAVDGIDHPWGPLMQPSDLEGLEVGDDGFAFVGGE